MILIVGLIVHADGSFKSLNPQVFVDGIRRKQKPNRYKSFHRRLKQRKEENIATVTIGGCEITTCVNNYIVFLNIFLYCINSCCRF